MSKTKGKMQWHVETRKTAELKPYAKNPRIITDDEVAELREQILESGFHAALTIDIDGVVLSGNQRLKVLTEMGMEEVTCIVPQRKLTVKEQERINLRSNLHKGRWDLEGLAQNFNMDEILRAGFDDADISAIFDDATETSDDHFDTQKALRDIKTPETKTGERIQLGRHTLMCGDSTLPEDVDRLLGKEKVQMIYCDPPYNIGLDYNKGISTSGKYQGEYKGGKDSKKTADYASMVNMSLLNAKAHIGKDAHIFYWCDEKYIGLFQQIFTEAKVSPKRVCLWIKNNFNMTPQLAFNKVYEPCVYGTVGEPWLNKSHRNFNEILNKEVEPGNQALDDIMDIINIWLVRRVNAVDHTHPTEKPITLHEKAIRRCTKAGDTIVDLFAGSGSTLMACEQMNRTCYTMEKDPIFCDVVIKRYGEFTGTKAKRL